MSFTKLFQRTTLPFDGGLSPITERSRVSPMFGGTDSIQDIIDGNATKDNDIHGRGSWGNGEDVDHSYKEKGDEYMIDAKIADAINRINEKKHQKKEKWFAVTLDGKEIEFSSQTDAQNQLRKMKIPYRAIVKKLAQKYSFSFINNTIEATFETRSTSGNSSEIGAAFHIGDGLFMTCAHCIKKYNKMTMPKGEPKDVTISLSKDNKNYPATLKKIDFNIDAAIVECKSLSDRKFLRFRPSKKILIGTRVFTVGTPSGFSENVTEGILSSRDRSIFQYEGAPLYLFTDAHVLPGNSGGSLVSEDDGFVIGMMALIVSGSGLYGLNAAIPSENLISFAKL